MKISTLILVSLLFLSNQSFAKLSGPFPDAPDFPVIIQQAFKKLTGLEMSAVSALPNKCKALTLDNKTSLADFDLLTGFPYASSINPSFWKWYFDCIEINAANSLLISEPGFKNSLGTAGAKHFADMTLPTIKETLWQSTPVEVRTEIARSIINTLIRDDVIAEFGAQPQIIVTEIDGILNHPSRSEFKVHQAVIVILQTVFKQKSFILE